VLISAHEEAQRGLIAQLEYSIAGATFDDFLDHARTGRLVSSSQCQRQR